MRLSFIFLLTLVVAGWGCKKKLTCKRYHEGEFSYTSKDPAAKIRIQRKGDSQVEINMKTGARVEKRIVWLNDCQFKLQISTPSGMSVSSDGSTISVQMISDEPLSLTTITGGTDNYYICRRRDKFVNRMNIDTVLIEGRTTISPAPGN